MYKKVNTYFILQYFFFFVYIVYPKILFRKIYTLYVPYGHGTLN
jgi:hypothetical protein